MPCITVTWKGDLVGLYKIPFPVHSDTRHSKAIYTRPFTVTNKVHRKSIPQYRKETTYTG
jgi:hypothetical protein